VNDPTHYPLPLQTPRPVWMACVSPESFEIAAKSRKAVSVRAANHADADH
jgi:alkanesulfonate monooxygenase SsuD/methylene tetrahydromethanopterin reductase-like flavin-dependent oxidoreductase (luciferase family)